jgi:hypothetical protein
VTVTAAAKAVSKTAPTPTPRKLPHTRYGVRNHPPAPGSKKYTLAYCASVLEDNPEGVTNLLSKILVDAERTDAGKITLADVLRLSNQESERLERNVLNTGRTRAKSDGI